MSGRFCKKCGSNCDQNLCFTCIAKTANMCRTCGKHHHLPSKPCTNTSFDRTCANCQTIVPDGVWLEPVVKICGKCCVLFDY